MSIQLINEIKGLILMQLAIRYDDVTHRKLKVIAAYKNMSLNGLMLNIFAKTVNEWEQEHGEIKFPME